MKAYLFLMLLCLLHTGCRGQNNDSNTTDSQEKIAQNNKQPKGSWTVNKAFDENGNLIQYDSIYSWCSNETYRELSGVDMASVLESSRSFFFDRYSLSGVDGSDVVCS